MYLLIGYTMTITSFYRQEYNNMYNGVSIQAIENQVTSGYTMICGEIGYTIFPYTVVRRIREI